MRYLYMICSAGGRPDYACDFKSMAGKMLGSFSKHNPDVTLLCNWAGLNDEIEQFVRSQYRGSIRFRDIPADRWQNRAAACKIELLLEMGFASGDEIIVLDADIVVFANLYEAFEKDFDLAYTSRPEPMPRYPVNLGLMALRWSGQLAEFIGDWVGQMRLPQWAPYLWFLVGANRGLRQDLLVDQDFLCAVVRTGQFPKTKIALHDLGPEYNWYPHDDSDQKLVEAWAEIKRAVAEDHPRVIHFKGHLKPLMDRIRITQETE